MSLINKMLQDLERRQDAVTGAVVPPTEVYKDLRPVPGSRAPATWRLAAVVVLVVAVGIGVFAWTRWGDERFSMDRAQPAVPVTAQGEENLSMTAQTQRPVPITPQPLEAQTDAGSSQQPAPPMESAPLPVRNEPKLSNAPKPSQPNLNATASVPAVIPTAKSSAPTEDAVRTKKATPAPAAISQSKPKPPEQQRENTHGASKNSKTVASVERTVQPADRLAILEVPNTKVTEATANTNSGLVEKKMKPLSAHDIAEAEYRQASHDLQKGRTAEAESHLRKALAADPAYFSARNLLVGVTLKTGRWQEAQKLLEEGIRLTPQHYSFVQLLARIHIKQGHEPQALALLEGSQQHATTDSDYQALLATLYQRAGRHSEAVTTYQRAVSLRPQEGRWWLGMAISLEAERSWQNAAQAYQRATASGTLDENLLQYAQQRLAVVKNK